MSLCANISQTIGKTPLLDITPIHLQQRNTRVLAKLEFMNPLGSVKDRPARAMLDAALVEGKIGEKAEIIEPTSGNMGIALAALCAERNYSLTLTMPENMSLERKKLLAFLGAKLVLTESAKGMTGAMEKAEEILRKNPGMFMPGQFGNPANPKAHEETTAPEIDEDLAGEIHGFIATVGTGGTLMGIARYFKKKKRDFFVTAVEPAESAVLSGKKAGPHLIQGIGAGFVPPLFDFSLVDEICPVKGEKALEMSRILAAKHGILCGISSGAAVYASFGIAERKEFEGKTLVTLLPSTGERYLSTPLFAEASKQF